MPNPKRQPEASAPAPPHPTRKTLIALAAIALFDVALAYHGCAEFYGWPLPEALIGTP